jgi:esterase/lipase
MTVPSYNYPETMTRLAAELVALAADIQRVQDRAKNARDVMDAIAQDSMAAVAQKYGFADAAEANTMYNVLTDANNALQVFALNAITNRLG